MSNTPPRIAASRGRNPNNRSDRNAGIPTEQHLEFRDDFITNTITGVQKDNLVVMAKIKQLNPSTESNSGTQPYQQNRVYDSEGEVPALSREKADLLIVPPPTRIAGWHENENVIAAHMDDAKRSTVQEHVYHKETGQLTAMGTGHVPKVIQVNPDTRSGGKQPYQHDRVYDSRGIATALNLDSSRTQVLLADPNILQLRDGRDNRSTLRSGRTTELGIKGSSIRRLTEVECERLQGFPDDHTKFGNYDGVIKKIPKTQRYKLMGNAVTVDIVALVASRIKLI